MDVIEKIYGGTDEGDKRMIDDIKSEMRGETDEFSDKFADIEIHILAKSNDENRCWTKKVTRTNFRNYANFFRTVHTQITLAIKGLGRFHQVRPFTNVEGPEGEDILEPSPEGLRN